MPEVDLDGVRLSFVERGSGAETVVFSHSYLLDHRHFEPQVAALEDRFRVLAYDHRDHGGSERPDGPYEMDAIYVDAVRFVEAMCDGPVHFVGLSTGGFVGVRLGIRRPDLLRSLVLMGTSAENEPRSGVPACPPASCSKTSTRDSSAAGRTAPACAGTWTTSRGAT